MAGRSTRILTWLRALDLLSGKQLSNGHPPSPTTPSTAPSSSPDELVDDIHLLPYLKDGIILCQLVNRLQPGSVAAINMDITRSYKALENIKRFVGACRTQFNLQPNELFEPKILYEGTGFSQVMRTLELLETRAADLGMGPLFRQVQAATHKHDGSSDDEDPSHTNGGSDSAGSASSQKRNANGAAAASVAQPTALALYSFVATKTDELSFDEGDIIVLTKVIDGGWWEGTVKNSTGWFPSNYCEIQEGMSAAATLAATGAEEHIYSPVTEDLVPAKPSQPVASAAAHPRLSVVASVQRAPSTSSPTTTIRRDKRESMQVYQNLVAQEIVDSERKHVHLLDNFLGRYLPGVQEAAWLNDDDKQSLCCNMEALLSFHRQFLQALEAATQVDPHEQRLGGCFLSAEPYAREAYTVYYTLHPRAITFITQHQDDQQLHELLKSIGISTNPVTLGLVQSLAKPMQRMTKYLALLKEAERYVNGDHVDATDMEEAVARMNDLFATLTETRKRSEDSLNIFNKKIDGLKPQDQATLGDLLQSATFPMASKDSVALKERMLLLFTNAVLILAPDPKGRFDYLVKERIPLDCLNASRRVNEVTHGFEVSGTKPNRSCQVSCSSSGECDAWISAINSLLAGHTAMARMPGDLQSEIASANSKPKKFKWVTSTLKKISGKDRDRARDSDQQQQQQQQQQGFEESSSSAGGSATTDGSGSDQTAPQNGTLSRTKNGGSSSPQPSPPTPRSFSLSRKPAPLPPSSSSATSFNEVAALDVRQRSLTSDPQLKKSRASTLPSSRAPPAAALEAVAAGGLSASSATVGMPLEGGSPLSRSVELINDHPSSDLPSKSTSGSVPALRSSPSSSSNSSATSFPAPTGPLPPLPPLPKQSLKSQISSSLKRISRTASTQNMKESPSASSLGQPPSPLSATVLDAAAPLSDVIIAVNSQSEQINSLLRELTVVRMALEEERAARIALELKLAQFNSSNKKA
ncbi:hypothetical protein CAOG_01550 [Capsaspora owczarzaki ATCC 30864]|uniref:Uncharacterized protein n=1 Tax=Capsaspora owczarzaki (strain ATCC 30864) TaxID=595528 RepID=A0A0D2X153_CAPO3|nr:hypothetical protein CAOG_01550 [Capsaspora owczarzaki ATCC 30864]KJE90209.1 hypothetical protein CAOG_001550 [Capsaspora owczarzaki ATCC 30864]|eukprot:XP_004364418.2 hypothetical protein CAOG_01550 [Capsaspora owczarzaki ATCC 30864]